jgi:hypothetical protein
LRMLLKSCFCCCDEDDDVCIQITFESLVIIHKMNLNYVS